MAEECHLDMDGMTMQHEIQLTDNQATKLVTESTTQEMSSHNDEAEDHVINRDRPLDEDEKEFLDKLMNMRVEDDSSCDGYLEQDYNKIGRLPPFLEGRSSWYHYFRPERLEIGPVYGGGLPSPTELKCKLARKFIETFSNDKTGECLLIEINNNYDYISRCYYDNYLRDYYRGDFLLDGCAILQFIHSYVLNELEEFGVDNHQASMIREELFLLRNQIPFRVLELLVSRSNNSNQLTKDIVKFLYMNNIMAPVDDMCGPKQWNDILHLKKQNLHLLDLLHSVIISGYDDVTTGNNEDNCCYNIQYLPCCYNQQKNNCCLPLFSCFHRKRPTLKDPLLTEHPNYDNRRFFRNVQELKSAGIEFKPCSSLATISFSSKCFNIGGQLKLPSLTVDEWTERKLMNLVAHEMCLGISNKNWYFVTSYLKFMDILIDREQDVKELRGSQILWNRLSSDVEVAKLFNEMGSKFPEPPQDIYSNVKTEIQTHCRRKCAMWMAQVYQQHFSSPWTVIALLAAGIVISLTFVQTWYAVHPKN